MRICPNCQSKLSRVDFAGWVLKVRGSATFDDEGTVESFSPLVSETTIAVGKELDGLHTTITCPHCSYTAPLSVFPAIRTCWLTGNVADIEIDVPDVGKKWVSATAEWQRVVDARLGVASTIEEILACVV